MSQLTALARWVCITHQLGSSGHNCCSLSYVSLGRRSSEILRFCIAMKRPCLYITNSDSSCCALIQFSNNLIGLLAAHLNPSPVDSQFHVRLIVMFTEAHTKPAEVCLSMLHIIVTAGELPPRKAIHWRKIQVIQPWKRGWIHQPSLHQIHLILPGKYKPAFILQ